MSSRTDGWNPPEGFKVECPEYAPSLVHIGDNKGQWATADTDSRIYGLGLGKPRKWVPGEGFSGRGWKHRLFNAAVAHLQGI